MICTIRSLQLLLALLLVVAIRQSTGSPADAALQNANHIFNAVHSSLRQWGSSYNHNGLSFFTATVPAGTQLYHGSPRAAKPVTDMEWLAFEPEHALLFAGVGVLPPIERQGNGSEESVDTDWYKEVYGNDDSHLGHFQSRILQNHRIVADQVPFHMRDEDIKPRDLAGWLHTYRTKHDLRLLYLDGMSAAKSSSGTLDSQDYILLNETGQHPVWWDYVRAHRLCKIAEEEYSYRIDGFLRMEGGFEVILCRFERHLESIRITRGMSIPMDVAPEDRPDLMSAYLQAVASRYHGIGKGRVRLNYDAFVTAYSYPFNLPYDTQGLPRLRNISFDSLSAIRNDVRELVMDSDAFHPSSTDWQAIADMIVTRYSPRLRYMTSTNWSTNKTTFEVERLMEPFIDYEDRNAPLEIGRCCNQFLPPPNLTRPSLAARAVTKVAQRICSTLVHILLEDDDQTPAEILQDLVDYLDWSTWKECKGCDEDTICFIPIWPLGTLSDRDSPSCGNASQIFEKQGYWGRLPRVDRSDTRTLKEDRIIT